MSDRSSPRSWATGCGRAAFTVGRFRRRRSISHRRAKPSTATRAANPTKKPSEKERSIAAHQREAHRTLSQGALTDRRKGSEKKEGEIESEPALFLSLCIPFSFPYRGTGLDGHNNDRGKPGGRSGTNESFCRTLDVRAQRHGC